MQSENKNMKKNVLAIDIGGSKLLIGIIDKEGNILSARKKPFINPNQDSVMQTVIEESEKLLDEGFEIDSIGVSIPGLANPVTGVWLYSCFSKISDFPLARILSEHFNCSVFIENDANICAYGEKIFGHAKKTSDFIWLTVSNGIGSGVFLNDAIFSGESGNAGEIGHINVVEDGYKCACGNLGCLEAYASGSSISRRYLEKTGLKDLEIDTKKIAELARRGNQEAKDIFDETGYYLGKAIASAINILNVPLVVLGGGVSMAYELFEEKMLQTIEKDVYNKANNHFKVCRTALNYEASLIGAAAYAIYRMNLQTDL